MPASYFYIFLEEQHGHGSSEDELPELMTEDGYSKAGTPYYEYEDEIWNYRFDG